MAVEDTDLEYYAGNTPSVTEQAHDPDLGNETILKNISKHYSERIAHYESIRSLDPAHETLTLEQQFAVSAAVMNELIPLKSIIDQKIAQLNEIGDIE